MCSLIRFNAAVLFIHRLIKTTSHKIDTQTQEIPIQRTAQLDT